MSNVVPLRQNHVAKKALYDAGLKLYRTGGEGRGQLTGWAPVDELYTVAQGQWTIITGIPQSGKSEWLDALMINLAEADPSWLFCVYSPENWPSEEHLIKLVEKRVRKPFREGPTPRMTEKEYADGAGWVLSHFLWLDTEMKTPVELIQAAVEYGSTDPDLYRIGVVLDPWNTLDHERGGMNETDYISRVLTDVTKLARSTKSHVWLVAHPTKIPKDPKDGKRGVPTPYDISGSAHWYNKADNIITVHRPSLDSQDVEIHVQKVRFKRIGHQGLATIKYDKVTGRYFSWGGPDIRDVTGSVERYADPESRY
jgi:twinkle protein